MEVDIQQAESQLPGLLDLIAKGEKVILVREGEPVAELVFIPPRRPFPFGIGRNKPLVPDGDEWWQPMTDAEADDWYEGR